MANTMRDDTISVSSVSVAGSSKGKRKRVPSDASSHGTNRSSAGTPGQRSTRRTDGQPSRKAIKRTTEPKASTSTSTLHSANMNGSSKSQKGKGKGSISSDLEESEEEIVVAYSRDSVAPSARSLSPKKDRKPEYQSSAPPRVPAVSLQSKARRNDIHEDEETKSNASSSRSGHSKNKLQVNTLRHSVHERLKARESDAPISPRRVKANGSWSSLDDTAAGPSDSGANKRLQLQVSSLRQKNQEAEDRFDEASSRCEQLQQKVAELERHIMVGEKKYSAEIGRLKKNAEGSSDAKRIVQSKVEEHEHEIMTLRMESDQSILRLHAEINRLQEEMRVAKTVPSWRDDPRIAQKEFEWQDKLAQQARDHQAQIEHLQFEIEKANPAARLAAKERQIENINLQHARELEALDMQVKQLQTLRNLDLASVHSTGNYGNPLPSQDVNQLQALVAQMQRKIQDREDTLQTFYQNQRANEIKHKRRLAAKDEAHNLEKVEAEEARRTLEYDREIFKAKNKRLTDEISKLERKVSQLRTIRPEWESLKKEVPALREANEVLSSARDSHFQEAESLRRERLEYTHRIHKAQSELQQSEASLRALLEDTGADKDWKGKYRSLKHSFREQVRLHQRQTDKLKKKLQLARKGALNVDYNSSDDSEETDHAFTNEQDGPDLDHLFAGAITSPPETSVGARTRARNASLSPTPEPIVLPADPAYELLSQQVSGAVQVARSTLQRYERSRSEVRFPPTIRERRADTRVPRHRNRVYIRSEDHTPYVPDEMVSDSDDEFLEWESQAYARSQSRNPDRAAALLNICWHRHILDLRGNRVRSTNLQFCLEFVESYGPLMHSRKAGPALLKHILRLVDLNQLSADEGGNIMRAFQSAT